MTHLSGKQIRFLRALGHHLDPLIMVGRDDIDANLLQALDANLNAHELLKVRIQRGCLLDRREVAAQLSEASNAAIVQVLGNTILLYRPSEDKKITLPTTKTRG